MGKVLLIHEDVELPNHSIPASHLMNVCKYGRNELTCKYIVYHEKRFVCAKFVPLVKSSIDQCDTIVAKGDNCSGL